MLDYLKVVTLHTDPPYFGCELLSVQCGSPFEAAPFLRASKYYKKEKHLTDWLIGGPKIANR